MKKTIDNCIPKEYDEFKFWEKVDIPIENGQWDMDACWEWKGRKDSSGYGIMAFCGMSIGAHRVSAFMHYKTNMGDSCDNPGCVNYRHLRIGTHQENMDDKTKRGRGGRNILSRRDVIEIFQSSKKQTELGKKYSVHQCTISNIKTGRGWAWLTDTL